MKLGVSTYSLYRELEAGRMTVVDVIDYASSIGAEHVEIVPLGFALNENVPLVGQIRRRAAEHGMELSNYAVSANFAGLEGEGLEQEVRRVKGEVELCAALGIPRMRHDALFSQNVSLAHFINELPRLIDACREIADYASALGITTSVENHGYALQHSERVKALVEGVARDNFRMTLDIGNFMCVDEHPLAAIAACIDLASMVHVKDFYYRPAHRYPGEGWFRSSGGAWLRGAIVGQGDIDMPEALRLVKASGYRGCLSIEFEGMEDPRAATKLGFEYVKRIWAEV